MRRLYLPLSPPTGFDIYTGICWVNYIVKSRTKYGVKSEEFDWIVYHAIAWNRATTIPALVTYTGGDRETVEASVERLVSYLLIERHGEEYRALSIEESILKCHLRAGPGIPLEIEDGVIKIPDFARKGDNA